MAEPRRFYKTIVKFEVLSEEPIHSDYTLADIYHESQEGRFVGRFLEEGPNDHILLNGAAMAEALVNAGSEPGFFELDDAGNSVYDDPEMDAIHLAEEKANFGSQPHAFGSHLFEEEND